MAPEEALEEPQISQRPQAPPLVFRRLPFGICCSDFQYGSIFALWKPIPLALDPSLLVPLQNVPKPASRSLCPMGLHLLEMACVPVTLGTAFQVREQLAAWG